jgi:predicted ATPase/DNA-binding winged helix-turn-helix (wHTH) protein
MPIQYRFEKFQFYPSKYLLVESGRPIALSSRAVAILKVLIERRGEYVSNAELLRIVWPNVHVAEGNVRVHMAALRKALNDSKGRFIVNAPARGYLFVAPVAETSCEEADLGPVPSSISRIPIQLIGRDHAIDSIVSALASHRLITICGGGGIGKTTVALVVAERWQQKERGEVVFADFGAVSDPAHVNAAIATSLSVRVNAEDMIGAIINQLQSRKVLLILDNCEHLIDAVAGVAHTLVEKTAAPLLATSREIFRIPGEVVKRLPPLPFPGPTGPIDALAALSYPAVQLFVERASAAAAAFELSDSNAGQVAEICRRLDGNPLAIEFAAARVEGFDVRDVNRGLDNRFGFLTKGSRTAPLRQITLKATLDWSYQLLDSFQRVALMRLAVFSSRFSVADAIAVASFEPDSSHEPLINALAELVAKSIVSLEIDDGDAFYRLLDTVRAYAREKLVGSGDADDVRRRHAGRLLILFQSQDADWDRSPPAAMMQTYRRTVDDLRSAIEWAFLAGETDEIGIHLTVASAPMWFHLCLLYEYAERIQFALRRNQQDNLHEMQLQCALAVALFTSGRPLPEMINAGERGLLLAERFDDIKYQLRALWALMGSSTLKADYPETLRLAEKFRKAASQSSEINAIRASHRIMALQSTFAGRHKQARRYCEIALRSGATDELGQRDTFVYDHMVVARGSYARILWQQGFPDAALREAEQAVADGVANGEAPSTAFVLAIGALPVAFWSGARDTAKTRVKVFCEHAAKHEFVRWQAYGRLYQWILSFVTTEQDQDTILRRDWKPASLYQMELLGSIHPSLVLPEALEPLKTCEDRWCGPEMLRAIGEQEVASDSTGNLTRAEALFASAMELAARQGALSWELRAATSLARLRAGQGRRSEAAATLEPIYGRFTEGFSTSDLCCAKRLLDTI